MTRSQLRTALITFVVATGVSLVALRAGSALLVGLAAAAIAVLGPRTAVPNEPDLPGTMRASRDGARGEVQDLAWALVGRDGHAGERAVRRLQAMGAVRLARHGVDLADPHDEERAIALVGRRAYVALAAPTGRSRSIADLRHTITALENLGSTTRTHPENT
jgi:hypothetical protein